MVENKKKKTLTISTSFNKKKLNETNFRPKEKQIFIPEKKKNNRTFPRNKNFFNKNSGNLNVNKNNFARKFAEQQATKRFIHSDKKKIRKK